MTFRYLADVQVGTIGDINNFRRSGALRFSSKYCLRTAISSSGSQGGSWSG